VGGCRRRWGLRRCSCEGNERTGGKPDGTEGCVVMGMEAGKVDDFMDNLRGHLDQCCYIYGRTSSVLLITVILTWRYLSTIHSETLFEG